MVFDYGECFGVGPEQRIVRGDANFPVLELSREFWFAREGQGDGVELQTAQHAQFKSQPAIRKLQHSLF